MTKTDMTALKSFSRAVVSREDTEAMVAELKDTPDRAAAVQLGAYVESILTKLLVNLVRPSAPEKLKSQIERATFKEKNDAFFHLKIIDERVYQNLEIIREIRNAFAHSPRSITFHTSEVVEAVKELNDDGKGLTFEGAAMSPPAREKFMSCCVRSIASVVIGYTSKILEPIATVMEALIPHMDENLRPHAEEVTRAATVLKKLKV